MAYPGFQIRYGNEAAQLADEGAERQLVGGSHAIRALLNFREGTKPRRGAGLRDGEAFNMVVGWDPNLFRILWTAEGPTAHSIQNQEEKNEFLHGSNIRFEIESQEAELTDSVTSTWSSASLRNVRVTDWTHWPCWRPTARRRSAKTCRRRPWRDVASSQIALRTWASAASRLNPEWQVVILTRKARSRCRRCFFNFAHPDTPKVLSHENRLSQ